MDKGTINKKTMTSVELYNRVSYLENEVKRLNEIISVLFSAFNGEENTEREQRIQYNNIKRHIPPPPTRALPYPSTSTNDSV